jgi:hypothetical protein
MRLIEEHPEGVGYLLKERVFDVAILVDALRRAPILCRGRAHLDHTALFALAGDGHFWTRAAGRKSL